MNICKPITENEVVDDNSLVSLLLVDDDEQVRHALAGYLEAAGFRVLQASNGKEALRMIGEGIAPDAVVTDVVMPVMDGIELAERLLALHASIPIVFFSGYGNPQLGPHFLEKPFSPAELLLKVGEALEAGHNLGDMKQQEYA